MNKIGLKKGILAVGLVMALSPAVLFADDTVPVVNPPAVTEPVAPVATPQTPADVKKAKQQKRQAAPTQPQQYEEIQDIPDPKNLGSD